MAKMNIKKKRLITNRFAKIVVFMLCVFSFSVVAATEKEDSLRVVQKMNYSKGQSIGVVELKEQNELDASLSPYSSQRLPLVALKTNLVYDALTSFNLGLEFRLGKHLTLDVPLNWKSFNWGSSEKMFRHFMVQPEIRWRKEAFNGHFLGAHLLYSQYNLGGYKLPLGLLPTVRNKRYQGDMYGVGVSYGYHLMLSNRFSFEFTAGLGYLYLDYDKYACRSCKQQIGSGHKHYFGPTKLGVSLIYVIK